MGTERGAEGTCPPLGARRVLEGALTMNAATTPTSDVGASTEALRRVKQAEEQWEAKVTTARHEAEVSIRRLAEESEQEIRELRAAVEQMRSEAVATARESLDREVAAIEAEGERAAEEAGAEGPATVRAKKDSLISAVLGPLAGP
jgi:vacuolar-type H+-ATPase subunit H